MFALKRPTHEFFYEHPFVNPTHIQLFTYFQDVLTGVANFAWAKKSLEMQIKIRDKRLCKDLRSK